MPGRGLSPVPAVRRVYDVRAGPVNAAAACASAKVVVVLQRERLGRERVQHFRLGHRLEQGIAAKTTRIRRKVTRVARQSKAPKHFTRLFLRIGTAWTIAVPDYRMHEETAVAGEQRSIFGGHDLEHSAIVGVSFIRGVEAEQPQVACELPKVPVGDEAAPRLGLQALSLRQNIRRRGNSKDFQTHGYLHRPAKMDSVSFGAVRFHGDNQIHLRMRHPTCLDNIFHRRLFGQHAPNKALIS